MNLERDYRKKERKASARIWQGAVVALAALLLNGLFATISRGTGDVLRTIVDILGWVVPFGLFAIAFALVISGAWMIWRLRAAFPSARG